MIPLLVAAVLLVGGCAGLNGQELADCRQRVHELIDMKKKLSVIVVDMQDHEIRTLAKILLQKLVNETQPYYADNKLSCWGDP